MTQITRLVTMAFGLAISFALPMHQLTAFAQLEKKQGQDKLLKMIENEALVGLKRLEKRFENFEAKSSAEGSSGSYLVLHLKYSNGNYLSEERKATGGNLEQQPLKRVGLNDQYCFVHQRNNKPDSKWLLQEVVSIDNIENNGNVLFRMMKNNVRMLLPTKLSGLTTSIIQLIQDPGFSIQDVEQIATDLSGRQRLIRLHFTYTNGENSALFPKTSDIASLEGSIDFLPDRLWAHISSSVLAKHNRVGAPDVLYEQSNEFTAADGLPVPASSTIFYRYKDGNGEDIVEKQSIETDIKVLAKPIPQREFLNSSFGFPEPSWYRPPPPYWLYVSLGGMALVIVGAVLIRYGKQLWRKG